MFVFRQFCGLLRRVWVKHLPRFWRLELSDEGLWERGTAECGRVIVFLFRVARVPLLAYYISLLAIGRPVQAQVYTCFDKHGQRCSSLAQYDTG